MRKPVPAELLVHTISDQKIAPGGLASSHLLNEYFERMEEYLNGLADDVDTSIGNLSIENLVQSACYAQVGVVLSSLKSSLNTILASSNAIPVDFFWKSGDTDAYSITLSHQEMMHDGYGMITAPVKARRSIIRLQDSPHRLIDSLQCRVAVHDSPAAEPDGTGWWSNNLYTLTPRDLHDGRWFLTLPKYTRTISVRVDYPPVSPSVRENCLQFGLLPACALSIRRVRLQKVSGEWVDLDLTGYPEYSGGTMLLGSRCMVHWNPASIGQTTTAEILLRVDSTQATVGDILPFAIYDLDVCALSFLETGTVTISLQAGTNKRVGNIELWAPVSASRGASARALPGGKAEVQVKRSTASFSPLLRGLTISLI